MEPRLKTGLVVQAALRLATVQAIPIVVARRGDADAGAILIKLNQREQGFTILAQTRTLEGERQVKRDPDLWVVEIEDRAGRPIFAGRVL